MGYIKHNTIIVISCDDEELKKTRDKAIKIFKKSFKEDVPNGDRLVSEIINSISNGYSSFFICPDGSKEGWSTSQNGYTARELFCDWLDKKDTCDYIEICFGGDDNHESIIRSHNGIN